LEELKYRGVIVHVKRAHGVIAFFVGGNSLVEEVR
jgi:hypothetical protein